jgi:hypothetical protein
MHPLLFCGLIGTIFFALANSASSQTPALDPRKSNKAVVAPKELKEKPLLTPVALPGIPQYTGQARYMSGFSFDNGNGVGITYCEKWRVKEDRGTVLTWYKTALASAGWKMVPNAANAETAVIAAMKDDNYVSVNVNQVATNDGYKSDVTLQSFQKNPK